MQLHHPIADGHPARALRPLMGARALSAFVAVPLTLTLAGGAWILALGQMRGMDMGVATALGPLGSFLLLWLSMMAAMMLPGTAPAVSRHAHIRPRVSAIAAFLGSYLAIWMLVGLAVYAAYRPHGTLTAGLLVIAAGVYELTPLKRGFRRRCRESLRSGFEFGVCCVGSSVGLMLVLLALGMMSVTWMSALTALVLAQKVLPANPAIDLPLALTIIGFGALIVIAPGSVPGLTPAM